MNLGALWLKVRPVLTFLTDWLIKGRQAGLWDKKPGPGGDGGIEGPK